MCPSVFVAGKILKVLDFVVARVCVCAGRQVDLDHTHTPIQTWLVNKWWCESSARGIENEPHGIVCSLYNRHVIWPLNLACELDPGSVRVLTFVVVQPARLAEARALAANGYDQCYIPHRKWWWLLVCCTRGANALHWHNTAAGFWWRVRNMYAICDWILACNYQRDWPVTWWFVMIR